MVNKYFKVWSEWDIGSEDDPNKLYVMTTDIKKIHRYLEDYCCGVGEDYNEALEEGLFSIREIEISDIVLDLG